MSESYQKIKKLYKIPSKTAELLKAALEEDIGPCDITTQLLIPTGAKGKAAVTAKEKGIFCGAPLLEPLFRFVDSRLKIQFPVKEGKPFSKGTTVIRFQGSIHAILKAERTALNLLGRLCAIATETRAFVNRIKAYPVMVLDTRKTTPLWRAWEKYAVRTGGGRNHRFGLYDEMFVKENHRKYGDFSKLEAWRNRFEIEVRNLTELKAALKLTPRVILFDNFKPAALKRGVEIARRLKPEIILEASGGITLDNIAHYAAMGVDWISVGSLTHSVRSLDFSLLIS